MIRTALVLLISTLPAMGEVVRVRSGEHASFTRLVFAAEGLEDWQLGRTDGGYALSLGPGDWRFETEGVFTRIPRDRLASLSVDATTGHLNLAVPCDCHAVPFEFRPGILVVDLRNGPPPANSVFEQPMKAGPPSIPPVRKQDAAGYDWITARRTAAKRLALQPDLPLPPAAMSGLRERLLEQVAAGMTEGIVELAEAHGHPKAPATTGDPAQARVALGELPGLRIGTDSPDPGSMLADGSACPARDLHDLASWAPEGSAAESLATARDGLSGEFDTPRTEAVTRSIRLLLHLGFGAEARQTQKELGADLPREEAEGFLSMSYLVDGEADPTAALRHLAECDGPVALWAVLSHHSLREGQPMARTAVLHAFSGLPVAQRRFLGPRLSELLVQAGDSAAAAQVRLAIERAPGDPGPAMILSEAAVALSDGEPEQAAALAAEALKDGGPITAEAYLAMVEARLAAGEAALPEMAIALEAFLADHQGTELEPRLGHAWVGALASSGAVAAGRTALSSFPEAEPEFWAGVARHSSDRDFLAAAVLSETEPVPNARPETAITIVRRLTSLGFGPAALRWLTLAPADDAATRLLQAEAQRLIRDGRAMMITLAGLEGEEADRLRQAALALLGPVTATVRPGEDGGAKLELTRLLEPQEPATGPLTQGNAALERGASTRAAIVALLDELQADVP